MTHKTRNRLMAFGILAFPFVVLVGFAISQAIAPAPQNPPTPNPTAVTNTVYPPR